MSAAPPIALVLGGYGGFGARLSRRLASDGWRVVVAGRSADKAAACALTLPGAEGIAADRDGDLAALLSAHRPLLLVDAAGPFQGSSYRVAEACVAAGVHYLDLADARAFVCGIGALDGAARDAGIAVVSGASSVPALSGAVVRELARGLARVDAIDLAISASDRATAGASVAAAVLGQAGQRFRLWRGGAWRNAFGWSDVRRETYRIAGAPPLARRVALVEVPDCALLPGRVAGRPEVTFRAGPEHGFQVLGIWLLAWLVRWGWVRSLAPAAPWLRPLQRLTAFLCSDRSAMAVTLRGGGQVRRWTLIAARGDGPEVPVLAAQLLARKLRGGTLAPGARDAGEELTLGDFRQLFDELAIREETISRAA